PALRHAPAREDTRANFEALVAGGRLFARGRRASVGGGGGVDAGTGARVDTRLGARGGGTGAGAATGGSGTFTGGSGTFTGAFGRGVGAGSGAEATAGGRAGRAVGARGGTAFGRAVVGRLIEFDAHGNRRGDARGETGERSTQDRSRESHHMCIAQVCTRGGIHHADDRIHGRRHAARTRAA